jgi:hypothetical protein
VHEAPKSLRSAPNRVAWGPSQAESAAQEAWTGKFLPVEEESARFGPLKTADVALTCRGSKPGLVRGVLAAAQTRPGGDLPGRQSPTPGPEAQAPPKKSLIAVVSSEKAQRSVTLPSLMW